MSNPTSTVTLAITLPVAGTIEDYQRAISQKMGETADFISRMALSALLGHLGRIALVGNYAVRRESIINLDTL